MAKLAIPIIRHIPHFIDYYKSKGYSNHTIENYKKYLQKFIVWLDKSGKKDLKPHELTIDDIISYKLYLADYVDERGHSLQTISQNYYLIALRAILRYFEEKDVVCLPPAKITLLRDARVPKSTKFIDLAEIKALLAVPDTKTKQGLRNRVILELLLSAGPKVNQLVKLDRDDLRDISKEPLLWTEKYLKTRQDKNRALFINYKAKRNSMGERLTVRSIQKIVKRYGKEAGIPFLITPEILRWARVRALLNTDIVIRELHKHNNLLINNYDGAMDKKEEKIICQSPVWHIAENIIKREITWLRNNIPVMSETYRMNPSFLKCDDYILRRIAILIASGNIKATELRSKNKFWNSITYNQKAKQLSYHGQEWHKKMMNNIYSYFKTLGNKVILEPVLNYGRADLGIVINSNKRNIYVEVDTVSLFKLWYNLSTMKDTTFLVIPSENRIIEFIT